MWVHVVQYSNFEEERHEDMHYLRLLDVLKTDTNTTNTRTTTSFRRRSGTLHEIRCREDTWHRVTRAWSLVNMPECST